MYIYINRKVGSFKYLNGIKMPLIFPGPKFLRNCKSTTLALYHEIQRVPAGMIFTVCQ